MDARMDERIDGWMDGGSWPHKIACLADLMLKCFPCYTLVSTRGGHRADFRAH